MKFFSVAVVSSLLAVVSVSAKSCASNQFSYNSGRTGDCCLNHGGSSNPPSPPSGKSCPGSFQWHGGYECCVPTTPNHPSTPTCNTGSWNHNEQCCSHPTNPAPPTPSGGVNHHNKRSHVDSKIAARNWRSKTISCPAGQSICNVADGITKSNTWACVDTMKDTNFCGGCGSNFDAGEDCSAIPNSWNVGCTAGACQVFTCEPGFRVSRDHKSCIALE